MTDGGTPLGGFIDRWVARDSSGERRRRLEGGLADALLARAYPRRRWWERLLCALGAHRRESEADTQNGTYGRALRCARCGEWVWDEHL